ncbi:MAG TPA: hypothetical protein VLA00_15865 [Xanthobacteraceae bacterium]|nr:hypothetical protein [Xanthobacteraceae bacterium]
MTTTASSFSPILALGKQIGICDALEEAADRAVIDAYRSGDDGAKDRSLRENYELFDMQSGLLDGLTALKPSTLPEIIVQLAAAVTLASLICDTEPQYEQETRDRLRKLDRLLFGAIETLENLAGVNREQLGVTSLAAPSSSPWWQFHKAALAA